MTPVDPERAAGLGAWLVGMTPEQRQWALLTGAARLADVLTAEQVRASMTAPDPFEAALAAIAAKGQHAIDATNVIVRRMMGEFAATSHGQEGHA